MKKTLFLAVLAVSLVFSGCNFKDFQVPEEVIVRTDATYDFTIANLDSTKNEKLDFSKYFDIQKMLTENMGDSESSDSKFKVYKYNDGSSNFQQLLLHMPLQEIEFDFGESFKDMDFTKAVQGFDVNKEFSIPDITALNEEKPLNLDNIEQAINAGVSFYGETSPIPQGVVFNGGDLFTSVEYLSGKLVIDATYAGYPYPQGKMTLKRNGTFVSEGNFNNGKIELDITGKTFTPTGMTLEYDGFDYDTAFIATIDSSSKIKRATGVTMADDKFSIPDVAVSFPFELADGMEATINEGSLIVSIDEPDSWEGNVIRDYTIAITGGIECNIHKGEPTDGNLNNQVLHNDTINATASVTVKLLNATIDFEDVPMVSVKTDIKTVTATVPLPDSFTPKVEQDFPLGDLGNFVQKIKWNEAGFNIKYTNKLPAGNDLVLNIETPFLGIDDSVTLIAGGDNAQEVEQKITGPADLETTIAVDTKVHVDAEVVLTQPTPKTILVSQVTPGKTYSIDLKIEPIFDWNQATIKMPDDVNDGMKGEFNTGMNKKAMFDSLGKDMADQFANIEIADLPLYIFADTPNMEASDNENFFKNIGFKGVIKTFYATQDGDNPPVKVAGAKETYLLGSLKQDGTEEKETLELNAMPALVKNDKDEYITKFTGQGIDFAKALNSTTDNKDATLFLSYELGIGNDDNNTITIDSEFIKEAKDNGQKTAIKIDVALILTLKFNVKDDVYINLLDMMKSEDENTNNGGSGNSSNNDDLFGRTEATKTEDMEDYLEVIKNARIYVNNLKVPLAGNIQLKISDMPGYNNGNPGFIEFGDGANTRIEISDPIELIKAYPLNPKIELVVAEGEFGLKRDSSLGGKVGLGVDARGDIKVFPIENKNNNGGNE